MQISQCLLIEIRNSKAQQEIIMFSAILMKLNSWCHSTRPSALRVIIVEDQRCSLGFTVAPVQPSLQFKGWCIWSHATLAKRESDASSSLRSHLHRQKYLKWTFSGITGKIPFEALLLLLFLSFPFGMCVVRLATLAERSQALRDGLSR